MFAILDRLSSSRYPEPRETQGASLTWWNSDVRIYSAIAWVSLALRFAAEHSRLIDRMETILCDPVPAVRLQPSRNLHVIFAAAPERMWAMGELIATREVETQVLAAFLQTMRRFSHSDPECCESVLGVVIGRIDGDLNESQPGHKQLQETLGSWMAQLFARQGRELAFTWLRDSAMDPVRDSDLINSFTLSLRESFFDRYRPEASAVVWTMCDRAQRGLALILTAATTISVEAHSILVSDSAEGDKQLAVIRYHTAASVVRHSMNQLYFGSGAYSKDRGDGLEGLPNPSAMSRFLVDYAEILSILAASREPGTLHTLIELYEFLIPGDPVTVFERIQAILLGYGEEEGYHHESLGSMAVVRVVQRYIADYRAIFEDDGRRSRLVAILQLFSGAGGPEALKLLYDLPELLR